MEEWKNGGTCSSFIIIGIKEMRMRNSSHSEPALTSYSEIITTMSSNSKIPRPPGPGHAVTPQFVGFNFHKTTDHREDFSLMNPRKTLRHVTALLVRTI